MPQTDPLKNFLLDALIIIIVLVIIVLTWLLVSLEITMTLVLLVGVWLINAYLKYMLGLGSQTTFADLSFAAFIFVASQEWRLVIEIQTGINQAGHLLELGVITFILWFLWIGNLSICRYLVKDKSSASPQITFRRLVRLFSCILSVISTVVAILPQYRGII